MAGCGPPGGLDGFSTAEVGQHDHENTDQNTGLGCAHCVQYGLATPEQTPRSFPETQLSGGNVETQHQIVVHGHATQPTTFPTQPKIHIQPSTPTQSSIQTLLPTQPQPSTQHQRPSQTFPLQNYLPAHQQSEARTQCEEIITDFLHALNGRDFSLTTWNRIAPNLRVDWGILFLQRPDSEMLPLHEWLISLRSFAKVSPKYHFEISNLTTLVDEKAGTAESLLNVELSGVFEGSVRQSVAGFGFVKVEESWEAVRHGAFAGPGLP